MSYDYKNPMWRMNDGSVKFGTKGKDWTLGLRDNSVMRRIPGVSRWSTAMRIMGHQSTWRWAAMAYTKKRRQQVGLS